LHVFLYLGRRATGVIVDHHHQLVLTQGFDNSVKNFQRRSTTLQGWILREVDTA
jgi:hypothetical protein